MSLNQQDKQTILIVDDNKSNLDLLLAVLKQYDTIPCLSGKTAIDIAKTEKIDLILLDVVMPDMDGFEVCKELKTDSKLKNIPILFLTVKHDTNDISKGFNLGAVDYIIKPFNALELLNRIKTHLELRSYQKLLETKVKGEIERNRLSEQIIFQQSKQIEIGELLNNIAHQWRQPLAKLGSINMYNTSKIELDYSLDLDELKSSFKEISSTLEFMSNTIDTFQNFYTPNKEYNSFYVLDAIRIAISLIDATLKINHIKLTINNINNLKIFGNTNEYAQVILAILNNAKDIIILRRTKKANITITIDSKDNKSIVVISDNAGGINIKKIDDIFLPFISQKNSSGIGLYMAKLVCNKNNSEIKVRNTKHGAAFTIIW
jgi:DNA-binding response OmpR family regulator